MLGLRQSQQPDHHGAAAMYDGVDLTGLTHNLSSSMTWEFLKRLRDTTQ